MAKEKIIESASKLFFQMGYNNAGMENINNVSSMAMALSGEMENKQLIVSASEKSYDKIRKLLKCI